VSVKFLISGLSDEERVALQGKVSGAELLLAQVARLSPGEIDLIRQAAPDAELLVAASHAEAMALAPEADALFGYLNADLFRAAPRLRWVQAPSAGVEVYLFPELRHSHVILTNARGLAAAQMADHTLALLLALTRKIPAMLRDMGRRDWGSDDQIAPELAGQTLLIVGLGSVGRLVAQRASAFDMRILATGFEGSPSIMRVDALHPPDNLTHILPHADHVAICCPLTPATYHLFDAPMLRRMKQSAFLINVARGGIVDREALATALEAGELAGAGLDVTEPEPLPDGHRLLTLENVILTPHCGGRSAMIRRRMIDLVADNLRRFTAGEPLRHVVDKRAGF